MTSIAHLLAALDPQSGDTSWRGTIPDDWPQGRTAYGGLSAAIALHCAMRSDVALPPLRSAQVSFIGPLAGPILVTAQRLRRGKNAVFIQADIAGDAGLGLRCTFVFMRAIASEVDHQATTLPDFARPGPADATFKGNPHVPFTRNFEFVDRRDGRGLKAAEWLR